MQPWPRERCEPSYTSRNRARWLQKPPREPCPTLPLEAGGSRFRNPGEEIPRGDMRKTRSLFEVLGVDIACAIAYDGDDAAQSTYGQALEDRHRGPCARFRQ